MNDIITAVKAAGTSDLLAAILPFVWFGLGISIAVAVILFMMDFVSNIKNNMLDDISWKRQETKRMRDDLLR